MKFIKKETDSGIYSFPMFKPEYCKKMIEEIENIKKSKLINKAPNTMNNYGVILDEFGFYPFLDELMKKYISVLTRVLYPEWGGKSLDDHHGFIVEYKIGKDEDLSYHMDSCEITLNVCLGKTFEGGSLFFNGVREHESERVENFQFEHKRGLGILHVGQHWHGANKIKSGERYNLILWMMSSDYRSSSSERYLKKCENDIQHN